MTDLTPEAPPEILALAQQRVDARGAKDYALSDHLRDQIAEQGWLIKDTAEGFELSVAPPFKQFSTVAQLVDSASRSVSAETVMAVIVDGWPEDTRTCLSALAQYLPDKASILAIDCGNVDGAGEVLHTLASSDSRIHEFHLSQKLNEVGWSTVVATTIELSDSEYFALMDLSTIWQGDALTPLLEVFSVPTNAMTGWRGVNVNVEDEWRSFIDAPGGDVDAVLGYYLVMRTYIAREIPPNPKAKFYRNADMEWSLSIRAAGHNIHVPPVELPLRQDRHRGYHDSDPSYREQQSKKTYDRLLQTYRGKNHILHSADHHGD